MKKREQLNILNLYKLFPKLVRLFNCNCALCLWSINQIDITTRIIHLFIKMWLEKCMAICVNIEIMFLNTQKPIILFFAKEISQRTHLIKRVHLWLLAVWRCMMYLKNTVLPLPPQPTHYLTQTYAAQCCPKYITVHPWYNRR